MSVVSDAEQEAVANWMRTDPHMQTIFQEGNEKRGAEKGQTTMGNVFSSVGPSGPSEKQTKQLKQMALDGTRVAYDVVVSQIMTTQGVLGAVVGYEQ